LYTFYKPPRGFHSRHVLEINAELKTAEYLIFFILKNYNFNLMLGIFPLVVAIEFLKEDIHCKDNS